MNREIKHVFNDSALGETRKLRRRLGAEGTDRLLLAQYKLLQENKEEISILRYMVKRLQDRLRDAVEYNKKLQYEQTLSWGLDEDLKDFGSPDEV